MSRIWVDNDATPNMVLEILYRAAQRRDVPVTLVANRVQRHPTHSNIKSVVVSAGPDAADDHIAELCQKGDVVITADIPLAARAVEAGALVINPRGRVLSAEDVRHALSIRDFHQELRDSGVDTGGPSAFGAADRQNFANALDRWIARRAKSREANE